MHTSIILIPFVHSGAVVNVQDEAGSTPLMEASRRGHYTIVKLLLEK